MNLLSLSSMAVVALMATQTQCFQIQPSFRSSSTALRQSSYEEQLKAYDEQMKAYYSGQTNGAPNGAPVSNAYDQQLKAMNANQVPPLPTPPTPPAPIVLQGTTVTPQETQVTESESKGIGNLAVAFLGLPLWLLVSSQFLNLNPTSVAPPAPVATPQMTLANPVATTSGVNPGGVIVLSQPITKQEVRDLFNLWNDALQTLDPATVARRYTKDGVLLPTLSDVPRTDFEGIKDYFVGFLSKKPVGKILEGDIYIGNNWAQDAGIYEFTFEDGSKVKARYSFVYAFEDGKWLISHQHSSLMPQETVRTTSISDKQVRALFSLWNNALQTGDPQTVAARYSKDAVLLPTLSDEARYTNDRIADYFVGFLSKKPKGEILEGNVKTGPNWAQDAGIYEFTFEDGSKTRGRYSFVYTYENGKWLISNHHSSIMPQPAVAAFKKVGALEQEIASMKAAQADRTALVSALEKASALQKETSMKAAEVQAVAAPAKVVQVETPVPAVQVETPAPSSSMPTTNVATVTETKMAE